MEVDIVLQLVGVGIDQRQLDIVALVHDHQRAGTEPLKVMAWTSVPWSSRTIFFSSIVR
jgi:hypothetical protein